MKKESIIKIMKDKFGEKFDENTKILNEKYNKEISRIEGDKQIKKSENKKYIGNIISNDVYKKVFSHLKEKRKLNIVKFNNNLQNKIDIKLDNYKIFYEDKYLNEQKNGNGKEYDNNGNLLFDGEYLYGKRWNGKVKEYYYNGKLKFDGEYYKGKRLFGKIYDINGKLIIDLKNAEGLLNEYHYNGKLDLRVNI